MLHKIRTAEVERKRAPSAPERMRTHRIAAIAAVGLRSSWIPPCRMLFVTAKIGEDWPSRARARVEVPTLATSAG